MADKLRLIAGFAGLLAGMYALCMGSAPRRGWMRGMEILCRGIVLCYLCALALCPLGIHLRQSPLAALSSGCLGLPGTALAAFLTLWP